jgi:hypothetical protein
MNAVLGRRNRRPSYRGVAVIGGSLCILSSASRVLGAAAVASDLTTGFANQNVAAGAGIALFTSSSAAGPVEVNDVVFIVKVNQNNQRDFTEPNVAATSQGNPVFIRNETVQARTSQNQLAKPSNANGLQYTLMNSISDQYSGSAFGYPTRITTLAEKPHKPCRNLRGGGFRPIHVGSSFWPHLRLRAKSQCFNRAGVE